MSCHGPGGPEGFSTEAALCLLYIGLNVYLVLIVVSLKMALTGHKRRYTDLRTRCPALAVVSSRRRPPFRGLDPRVTHGMVPRTSPPIPMPHA
jgi:hypothetical protein